MARGALYGGFRLAGCGGGQSCGSFVS
jgi:hypothetical protein